MPQQSFDFLLLRRNPFVKFLFFLVVGIVLALSAKQTFSILVLPLLGISFAVLLFLLLQSKWIKSYRNNPVFGGVAYLFIVLFGFFWTSNYMHYQKEYHFFQYNNPSFYYKGILKKDLTQKKYYKQGILHITEAITQSISKPVKGKLLVKFALNDSISYPKAGDVIIFRAKFNSIPYPTIPYSFNWKNKLSQQQIDKQTTLYPSQYAIVKTTQTPFTLAQQIRRKIIYKFKQAGLQDQELALVAALLLGDKQYLSTTTKNQYSIAGAMHVLAVSGLHVGIILLLIRFLFSFFLGKDKHKIAQAFVSIVFIWGFAFITGLSVSVLRAATMFSFIALGTVFNQKISIYNTIALSAFVLLIYNPLFLLDVGFQLSYLALLGIVFIHPKINSWFTFKHKILDNLWSLTAVSISAQIATLPISLYYFHQIPIYSIVTNFFVIYLATIILLVGIFALFTSFVPLLFSFFTLLLKYLIILLNYLVHQVTLLPTTTINSIQISWQEVLFLYGAIIFGVIFFSTQSLKWLKITLVSICLFFIYDHIENYNLYKTNKFAVYYLKNSTAINIIKHKQNTLILDHSEKEYEQKILNTIKPYWNALDLPMPTIYKIDPNYNLVYRIGKLKIAIINQKINTALPPEIVDYAVIRTNKNQWDKIAKRFVSKNYILDYKISNNDYLSFLTQNRDSSTSIYSLKNAQFSFIESLKNVK